MEEREKKRISAKPSAAASQSYILEVGRTTNVLSAGGGTRQRGPKTERSHSFLMSISERRKTVQKAGLCFCCLDSSHQSFRCLVRCAACGGKHHRLCCPVDVGEVKVTGEHSSGNGSTETDSATNEGATGGGDILHVTCHVQEDREVVLPTARVLVHGVNTAVHCTVLFDSGSDRSYVSAELVEQSWVSVVWQ